jgi:hypothetical protein
LLSADEVGEGIGNGTRQERLALSVTQPFLALDSTPIPQLVNSAS